MKRSLRVFNIVKGHTRKTLWQSRQNILQYILTPIAFETENSHMYYKKNNSLKNSAYSCNFFSNQVVNEREKSVDQEKLEEIWGGVDALKAVTFITNNINEIISKNPEILVFFSASWCPHCKVLKKVFGQAAVLAKNSNISVQFATFEIDNNLDVADAQGVIGIPVLKFYRDGKFITNYKGKRTAEDLLEFVKNPPKHPKESKKAEV